MAETCFGRSNVAFIIYSGFDGASMDCGLGDVCNMPLDFLLKQSYFRVRL